MADFTLVDPKGWEYDLHSVRPSSSGYRGTSFNLSIFIAGILSIYGLLSDIQHSMVHVHECSKSLIFVAEGPFCRAGMNDHGVIYFNHSTSFWSFRGQ